MRDWCTVFPTGGRSPIPYAIVAVAEIGRGSVIVISDGSTLYDLILYDAITGNADNLKLISNIAGYVIPETPRIFDIEFNYDGYPSPANVTTYIFDEDLSTVSISVEAPNGTIIEGTIEQSLGYKYVSSFMLETGGFYEITVIAQDDAGNVKSAKKIVLIPASTVQDYFSIAIIIALLGVVMIGVIFVILNKVTSRRAADRAWEVPVPTGTPPEIT